MKIIELLDKHRKKNKRLAAWNLFFQGVGSKDVYNITAPFEFREQTLLVGRVEARDNEHSELGFFEPKDKENEWLWLSNTLHLKLQDPFVTYIDGQLILGGVHVEFFSDGRARWRTDFYRLGSLQEAEKIFEGPWGMKDLRLKQLSDGRILTLTRPQGDKGGRGRIGATILNRLSDVTKEKIEDAPLLSGEFLEEEWMGSNEIYEIDGKIFVLGHIANFDEKGDRHYYALTFELDPDFKQILKPHIIAERTDFLPSAAKRPDLKDVVFSGGLVLKKERALLYAGISDASAQVLAIENPFRR